MRTMSYGSADIGRTSFASSPLLHLLYGVQDSYAGSLARRRWWRDARRLVPARAAPLLELVNFMPDYIPAFLVPDLDSGSGSVRRSLDDELDAVRAVSEQSIAFDLAEVAKEGRTPPRLLAEVSRSGTSTVPRIVDALRLLFHACLADDWPDLQHHIEAEVSVRAHQMAARGVAAVLNDLDPVMSWQDDALTFTIPSDGPLPGPAGRGFVLMPNIMTERMGGLVMDSRQPTMTYHLIPGQAGPGPSALGALIGVGRERALRAVGGGCGTAELAARLGIKPPAASAHAAALRSAGLLATHREGRGVRHVLTPLGTDLLAANPR